MSSRIFIEPLRPIEELLAEAAATDLRATESLTAPSRRREALAWRAVVRREVGREARIGYDEWGAPVIAASPLYISVSHSRESVAVVVGDAPCAIDIESRTRNFEKVASRYLTAQERALCTPPDFLAVAWCAKECLYKYYHRGGLDLLRDLHITSVDFARNRICGTILDGAEVEMRIDLRGAEVAVVVA